MDLLSLAEMDREQISEILAIAKSFRENPVGTDLAGKTVVLFFPTSSIRTRITFEKAVFDLGGQPILFPSSALDKKEEIIDVARYLDNWVDLAIVRHPEAEKLRVLSHASSVPVINAMTSANHPCEILSDYFSIGLARQTMNQLRLAFVGPAGNILRSWINLATVLNLRLVHVCRAEERIMEDCATYRFTTDLDSVLPETDVILTDPLPPEFQDEEYYNRYQITEGRLALLPDHGLLNPCPPFSRGEEISPGAIESERFVGYQFKENLLYVQQAIIRYCLSG